jgi:hypothetical protein
MVDRKGQELITIMSPSYEPFKDCKPMSISPKNQTFLQEEMPHKRLDPISMLCKNERKMVNSKIENPVVFSKDLN